MKTLEPLPSEKRAKRIEKLALTLIFLVFLLCLSLTARSYDFDGTNMHSVVRVKKYIQWFHQNVPYSRTEAALEYANIVVYESEKQDIDPMLSSVIISLESSWKPGSRGAIGEFGLMQVVPGGVCDNGKLDTPEGQIQAGTACLALSREICGDDLKRILTKYASGKCVSKSKKTQSKIRYRIRAYKRAVKMFPKYMPGDDDETQR